MDWTAKAIEYFQNNAATMATRAAVALLILAVVVVTGRVLAAAAVRVLRRSKAEKLGPTTASAVRGLFIVLGVFMALDHVGINVATLLAGAGVAGLAIGFGAQALVRDVISGFFLMVDGAVQEGDVAKVGEAQGLVESVGLRVTRVRAFDGQLWYIPNGQITQVGNFSRTWCRAIVQVGVAYEHDAKRALAVLQRVGEDYAKEHADLVLEPPQAQGIMAFNDSDVALRLVVKVKAAEHWGIERDLRVLVKAAFDQQGVEIPFPRRVVYQRQESDATPSASSDA